MLHRDSVRQPRNSAERYGIKHVWHSRVRQWTKRGKKRLHLCVCKYLFSEGHAFLLHRSRLLHAAREFDGDGTVLAFLGMTSDIRTHAKKKLSPLAVNTNSPGHYRLRQRKLHSQGSARSAMPGARTLTSVGGAQRGPVKRRREKSMLSL